MAGTKPQAPRWMQRAGLEWFFRLASEPGRLWKRYLVYNTVFVLNAIAQWTRIREYPLEER
jgi:N-acetylglucosaminyldiphosphoundecaprenol N-acetyl-beta-D-mannosaminyltransferase